MAACTHKTTTRKKTCLSGHLSIPAGAGRRIFASLIILSASAPGRSVKASSVDGVIVAKNEGAYETRGKRKTEGYQMQGYADADGMETVEEWECHPECAVRMLDEQSGERPSRPAKVLRRGQTTGQAMGFRGQAGVQVAPGTVNDTGGASRFFFVAKPSHAEREAGLEDMPTHAASVGNTEAAGRDGDNPNNYGEGGKKRRVEEGKPATRPRANVHPTVKSVKLMRWLVRLACPASGSVLDPFMGSGTTGIACATEGRDFIGIEQEENYFHIAEKRIAAAQKRVADACPLFAPRARADPLCASALLLLAFFFAADVAVASPSAAVANAYADALTLPPTEVTHYRYLWIPTPAKHAKDFRATLNYHLQIISREGAFYPGTYVAPDLLRIDLREYRTDPKTFEKLKDVDVFFRAKVKVKRSSEERLAAAQQGKRLSKFIEKGAAAPWLLTNEEQATLDKAKTPEEREAVAALTNISRLIALCQTEVPVQNAEHFFVNTARQISIRNVEEGVGYHDWLGLKKRDDFFNLVGLDEKKSIDAQKEWRAVVERSGISQQNRQVAALSAINGRVWTTFDTFTQQNKGQAKQSLRRGEFKHDAEEHYGFLPNGLPATFLCNAAGEQQASAPDKIGPDDSALNVGRDHRVHANLSCIRCHGADRDMLKPIDDWVRRTYRANGPLRLQSPDKNVFLELQRQYFSDLQRALTRDREDYVYAIARATTSADFPKGLTSPQIAKLYGEAWNRYVEAPVTLADAARELGTTEAHLLFSLREIARLQGTVEPVLSAFLDVPAQSLTRLEWEEFYGLTQTYIRRFVPVPEGAVLPAGAEAGAAPAVGAGVVRAWRAAPLPRRAPKDREGPRVQVAGDGEDGAPAEAAPAPDQRRDQATVERERDVVPTLSAHGRQTRRALVGVGLCVLLGSLDGERGARAWCGGKLAPAHGRAHDDRAGMAHLPRAPPDARLPDALRPPGRAMAGAKHGYRASERKLRLVAAAMLRAVWHALADPASRPQVERLERIAEGEEPPLSDNVFDGNGMGVLGESVFWTLNDASVNALNLCATRPAQCDIFREVIGNPWRRVSRQWGKSALIAGAPAILVLDAWMTADVLACAQAAHEERPGRKCERCGRLGDKPGEYTPDDGWNVSERCTTCGGTSRVADGALDPVRLSVLADCLTDAGCPSEVEAPCPTCGPYHDDPSNPFILYPSAGHEPKSRAGYHPERDPASGRHEGDWTNCKTCNGGGSSGRGPGVVVTAHPLIGHLRSPGLHVRGCWALDCVLGKE